MIGLCVEIHERSPHNMRAGLIGVPPRKIRRTVLNAQFHQTVIRRMKFDLVEAISASIKGFQHGFVFVGEKASRHHFATRHDAEISELPFSPPTAFAMDGVAQGKVRRVHIEGCQ